MKIALEGTALSHLLREVDSKDEESSIGKSEESSRDGGNEDDEEFFADESSSSSNFGVISLTIFFVS